MSDIRFSVWHIERVKGGKSEGEREGANSERKRERERGGVKESERKRNKT